MKSRQASRRDLFFKSDAEDRKDYEMMVRFRVPALNAPTAEKSDLNFLKTAQTVSKPQKELPQWRTEEQNWLENEENENWLLPDGETPTFRALPDLGERITEAERARYVRSKGKRDFEIELTTSEIFRKAQSAPQPRMSISPTRKT